MTDTAKRPNSPLVTARDGLTVEEFRKKVAEDRQKPKPSERDPFDDFGEEIDNHPIHNPTMSQGSKPLVSARTSKLVYDSKRRTIIAVPSMMWGRHKENGVWIAPSPDWRLRWRGHDALYIAAGRLRLRIMKRSPVSQ